MNLKNSIVFLLCVATILVLSTISTPTVNAAGPVCDLGVEPRNALDKGMYTVTTQIVRQENGDYVGCVVMNYISGTQKWASFQYAQNSHADKNIPVWGWEGNAGFGVRVAQYAPDLLDISLPDGNTVQIWPFITDLEANIADPYYSEREYFIDLPKDRAWEYVDYVNIIPKNNCTMVGEQCYSERSFDMWKEVNSGHLFLTDIATHPEYCARRRMQDGSLEQIFKVNARYELNGEKLNIILGCPGIGVMHPMNSYAAPFGHMPRFYAENLPEGSTVAVTSEPHNPAEKYVRIHVPAGANVEQISFSAGQITAIDLDNNLVTVLSEAEVGGPNVPPMGIPGMYPPRNDFTIYKVIAKSWDLANGFQDVEIKNNLIDRRYRLGIEVDDSTGSAIDIDLRFIPVNTYHTVGGATVY